MLNRCNLAKIRFKTLLSRINCIPNSWDIDKSSIFLVNSSELKGSFNRLLSLFNNLTSGYMKSEYIY